jgi:hypothetical protein
VNARWEAPCSHRFAPQIKGAKPLQTHLLAPGGCSDIFDIVVNGEPCCARDGLATAP